MAISYDEMSRLLEFSRDLNIERCSFPNDVNSMAWQLQYGVVEETSLLSVAAEILVKDYEPLPMLESFYVGYAEGDPQINPIN